MSRDPFDELHDHNPVPDQQVPPAPMDSAERIIGKQGSGVTGWPGWAIAAVVAAAVLIGGGAWMLLTSPGSDPLAVDSTDPPVASTAPGRAAVATIAYFYVDEEPRPTLVPVPRSVTADSPVDAAVAAVLSGVIREEGEAEPGLITFLPPAAVVRVTSVSDGLVTVDVSPDLTEPGEHRALAQIVFTLTRLDEIDGVRFRVGDEPYGFVTGSRVLVPESEFADHPSVDDPATRLTFEDEMSLAMIESPAYGAVMTLPGTVSGVVNSVGGDVHLILTDQGGNVVWSQTIHADCGTPWSQCRGSIDWSTWQVEIPAGFTEMLSGSLVAEASGSGLPVIGRRSQPVILTHLAGPPATATTTTSTTTTATVPEPIPGPAEEVAVYLMADHDESHTIPGPTLIPAMRTTAILSAPVTDLPRTTLEFLLRGPTPGEAERMHPISSAIPPDTRLLGLMVVEGIATVDLSAEFVSGGGSLSMRARLAQIVFTLTRFPEIESVRFLIEGAPTTVFGGEGVELDDPAAREEFDDLLPAILIEEPFEMSTAGNPVVVRGTANVFEATVMLAVTDADGLILWEGFATASCGTGCRGEFEAVIAYRVEEPQTGSLIAWEESAEDGSQLNVREHRVWLE